MGRSSIPKIAFRRQGPNVHGFGAAGSTSAASTFVPLLANLLRGGSPPTGNVVSGNQLVATNYGKGSMGGSVVTYTKKRKRKSYRMKVPKRIRKYVSKAVKNPGWKRINQTRVTRLESWESARNKVRWAQEMSGTHDNNTLYTLSTVYSEAGGSGVSSLVNRQPTDVAGLSGGNQYFKIKGLVRFLLKNNSTSPCEIIFYHVRCVKDTGLTPIADLDQARGAQQSLINLGSPATLPASPMALDDDFHQYWTTTSMRERNWKMVRKLKIVLAAGDEIELPFAFKQLFNTKSGFATTYRSGAEEIIVRQIGRPSHAATTTNTCIAETKVDVLIRTTLVCYQKEQFGAVAMDRAVANGGFNDVIPFVAGDAVAANVAG